MQIARHGAKVEVSPRPGGIRKNALGLLLEAASRAFRSTGSIAAARAIASHLFDGDPAAPDNAARIASAPWRHSRTARRGRDSGSSGGGRRARSDGGARQYADLRARHAPSCGCCSFPERSHHAGRRRAEARQDSRPGFPANALAANGLKNVAAAMVGQGEVYYLGNACRPPMPCGRRAGAGQAVGDRTIAR